MELEELVELEELAVVPELEDPVVDPELLELAVAPELVVEPPAPPVVPDPLLVAPVLPVPVLLLEGSPPVLPQAVKTGTRAATAAKAAKRRFMAAEFSKSEARDRTRSSPGTAIGGIAPPRSPGSGVDRAARAAGGAAGATRWSGDVSSRHRAWTPTNTGLWAR